jgi:predicted 3-demethylubiquinone-9 3-methyltransferase (glyoxalase superfamily)
MTASANKDARIAICLWFDGNGHDAAAFYVSLLPNSAITGRFPDEAPVPMITEFDLDGVSFQALSGGDHNRLTPAASLVWRTRDQAETDRLWAALTTMEKLEIGPMRAAMAEGV